MLVDVRRGIESEERDLIEFLRVERTDRHAPKLIVVATKVDKLAVAARKLAVAKVGVHLGDRAVAFSAVSGEGQEILWKRIRDAVTGPTIAVEGGR